MKIALLTDTHLQHLSNEGQRAADVLCHKIVDEILSQKPDVVLHLGDIQEGNDVHHPLVKLLLDSHPQTFYVLGNHDIWRIKPLPPPQALSDTLRRMDAQQVKTAQTLEKTWADTDTLFTVQDTTFVGGIGFPDFLHPALAQFPPAFWDRNPWTIDPRFIDLRLGWKVYTDQLHAAFFARLDKAFQTTAKNIVVAMHYPFFEAHSHLNMVDAEELKIWPFFYNWSIGVRVKELAAQHPDQNIWALAGHAHEFCQGRLNMVDRNLYVYGMKAIYGALTYKMFDLTKDLKELKQDVDEE